jgi:ribosomal protein L14E/L6E/L27E
MGKKCTVVLQAIDDEKVHVVGSKGNNNFQHTSYQNDSFACKEK